MDKLLEWQGLIMAGIGVATGIAIALIRAAVLVRAEVRKFIDIQNRDSTSAALNGTRLSRDDAKKRNLTS